MEEVEIDSMIFQKSNTAQGADGLVFILVSVFFEALYIIKSGVFPGLNVSMRRIMT